MSTLDEKKAEIDNLLHEFSWHCNRVTEITRETGRLIESLQNEHGVAALPIVMDSYARLQRIASGAERSPSAAKA